MPSVVTGEMNMLLGRSLGVSLNNANTDVAIPINAANYIVRRVVITNASKNLAASLATLGLFTSTGGGGTTVVSAALLQSLTAASKFVDSTIAVTTDKLTAATIYARNVIADGGAATCDVYIFGDVLPV